MSSDSTAAIVFVAPPTTPGEDPSRPTSTPIKLGTMGRRLPDRPSPPVVPADSARAAGGYHGSPDGLGGEALPALPRRPSQGQGSGVEPKRTGPTAAPHPPQARPTLVEADSGAPGALPDPRDRVGARRATSSSGTASRRRTSGSPPRPQALDEQHGNATEHPPARDRPRPAQRARIGQPQRLDHARPRGHRQAPDRVPLDPARSRRRDPRIRRRRRSTRRCRSAGRGWPCGRSRG